MDGNLYGGLDHSPTHSGAVVIDGSGAVVDYHYFPRPNGHQSFHARCKHANDIFEWFIETPDRFPAILGLEDYALGRGSNVGFQIAETTGLFKYLWTYHTRCPLALIAVGKLKKYVLPSRHKDKQIIIDWANSNGFVIPVKVRGGPGYDKTARGDLADAFVLARMVRDLDAMLSEALPPKRGHIFLDPDTGIAFRQDLLFNRTALGVS